MQRILLPLFFQCLVLALSAQHIEDNIPLLDSLLDRHKGMHFYQSPTLGRADSVWHRNEHIYLYFDTDSICRQFVRKGGYNAIPDEMDYLYFAVFTEMTVERRMVEIEKMKKIATKYNSKALLREVELQQIILLPDSTDEQFDHRLKCLRQLLQKTAQQKDTLLQIRIMEIILSSLRYNNRHFEALEEAVNNTKFLNSITDKQDVGQYYLYFFIGELFYTYAYYQQAVPLLKKALKPANYFFQRNNLCARNNLGLYYRREGNLELSNKYFRSMLSSPDQVKYRGEYDAIAICNLGKNYLLQKNYDKAERLLQKGLSVMIGFDPAFSTGIYINLGNCYTETGKLPQAKAMIDSAIKYIHIYDADNLYIELYPLMNKYYAAAGDAKTSMVYADSTVKKLVEYQKKYNVSTIFQIEKKLYEAEKEAKDKQLKVEKMKTEKYRNGLIAGLIILFLTLGFYLLYARLRKRKNRILYKRMMEENRIQAELSEVQRQLKLQQQDVSDKQSAEKTILQRLKDLMQAEQLFLEPKLDRKTIANRLLTNENYLANAIREGCKGQTFSDYINSFRLAHAYRLLQDNPQTSIKEISLDAGFSSYKYFHKLFRQEFGMSPSEFRGAKGE